MPQDNSNILVVVKCTDFRNSVVPYFLAARAL